MSRSTKTCLVKCCPSPKSASFFKFPKEKNIQNLWSEKLNLEKTINLKTAKVCSVHFKPEDFVRDLKHELMNLPLRKILKEGSVPSLFLGGSCAKQECDKGIILEDAMKVFPTKLVII